jgi:hypothetical protein
MKDIHWTDCGLRVNRSESPSLSRAIFTHCARLWTTLWTAANGEWMAALCGDLRVKKLALAREVRWKEGFGAAQRAAA